MNKDDPMLLITKFAFTFAYTVYFGAVMRAAHDWFPYSPTFTSEPGRWMGWQDVLRWALSGVFLFMAPIAYLVFVLAGLSRQPPPIVIPSHLPSLWDIFSVVVLLSLAVPPLGLYDFWQAIVRRWPQAFYSEWARKKIEEKHKSAFTAGRASAVVLGCIWFFIPTLCLLFMICWKKS